MNPFRHSLIILIACILLLSGWPVNFGHGEECPKSVGGAKAACHYKDQDKYDAFINVFELKDLIINEFKAKTYASGSGGNSQNVQSIRGKLNGNHFFAQLSLTGASRWARNISDAYTAKNQTKKAVKDKTIRSFDRAENFNHRRSSVAFYIDNYGNKCAGFRSVKDEKLLIVIYHCNYTDQTVEKIKDYLSNKVRRVTRAENKAAYGNANRTTSASTSTSSSNTNTSLADKPEKALCNLALTSANKGVMWDTGAGYRKYVDEAKRRGYTSASCAKALGRTATVAKSTSSQSNTSDQSFKRTMCESSKASSKVQASFMQSLSENELTKFLEAGQDCSIF